MCSCATGGLRRRPESLPPPRGGLLPRPPLGGLLPLSLYDGLPRGGDTLRGGGGAPRYARGGLRPAMPMTDSTRAQCRVIVIVCGAISFGHIVWTLRVWPSCLIVWVLLVTSWWGATSGRGGLLHHNFAVLMEENRG